MDYDNWENWDGDNMERKGGKPSKGTPKDGRLKENDGDSKPDKKPFPGAATPFPPKKGK